VKAASNFGGSGGDIGLATRALAALNSNNVPAAIDFAERAVAKTPNDAGFRGLLGNAYFAGGRFASAEAAYKDALALYANQPQLVLKLALAEIAQGKAAEAVGLITSARGELDPADYGLALALAGRGDVAVPTLETAARAQGADARVRQNLALAYALIGDWTKARTIAAQDVPGNQLDARIQQWMQLAKPAHAADQVASLTGVKPVASDPGQPVRLALRKGETQLAQAEPVVVPVPPVQAAAPTPAPQFADAAPIPQPEIAAPAPPPADPARVAATVERPAPAPISAAPLTLAMAAAAAPEAPAAFAVMAAKFAPVAKPVRLPRAPAPVRPAALRKGSAGAVMQLGAYRSPQYVSAAWNHLTQRYPALRAYLPLRARFDSPKGTFWRLSVQGFASQREAIVRCQLLKSRGGNCFVRGFADDAPVQIASR